MGTQGRGAHSRGLRAPLLPKSPLLGKVSAKPLFGATSAEGRRGPGGRGSAAGAAVPSQTPTSYSVMESPLSGADDTAQPLAAGSVEPVGAAAALVSLAAHM